MNNYTGSPDAIAATHCLICNRPLRDAESVEFSIGPDCRKRIGITMEMKGRAEANDVIRKAAVQAHREDWTGLSQSVARLSALGFHEVVNAVLRRFPTSVVSVRIVLSNDTLSVMTPYEAEAIQSWRELGAAWDKSTKSRIVCLGPDGDERKRMLYDLLKKYFNGCMAVGPKGLFRIGCVAQH